MVQADATRNYYADLGVPANADENDIRKAFRQLALKYHPDRNPGREAEFVTKFQQIQAAHEILSDPTQRGKYDQERRKFRGINLAQPGPNTPRTRPPPPTRQPFTTTPSGSYYRAAPPRPAPQRPPPPQHHSTTYTTGADRFTSKNFRAPPTAQQPKTRQSDAEARANVFTAWQKMKQPRGEEQPQPQPQNPNINNPNGTPFGRSKSTRTPSKKGFDPMTPGVDEGQARSAYRSNYERPVPSPPQTADPLKQFKEQTRGDGVPNVPYAEGNRVRTPYFSNTAGERTSMFAEPLGRSSSVRNSPTHGHRATSSHDAGSFSDSGRKGQRNSYSGKASNPFRQMYPSSSDEESEADVFRPRPSGKKDSPLSNPPAPPPPPPPPPPQQYQGQGLFGAPSRGGPTEFRPETTPAFKSRSSESINVKFSPSDWHGKFEGKPDYFAPNMQPGVASKGRTSPTRGRPSQRTAAERNPFARQSQPPPPPPPPQFSQSHSSQMPPPPAFPPPPPSAQFPSGTSGTASAPQSAKFKPEQWAETFKEPTWVLPEKTSKETSPRRGSTATTRSKTAAARKASAVPTTNGTTAEKKAEGTKPKYQASAEDASSGDGDAMDIDSGTPPVEKPPPLSMDKDKTFKPGTPIKFSSSQTAPSSPQDQKGSTAGTVPNGSATAPSSATEPKPSSGLNGLAGLKNVEPFLPTHGGLSGLGDLSDTLPFQSKSSSTHPTKPNIAQKLKYPPIPVAPAPPTTLDEPSTKQYFRNMGTYVKQYREYNRTMLAHFASREAELNSLDEGFVMQRGETSKKIGFVGYVNKAREDQAVLEAWKLGMEMHAKAMGQCEEVRNKTMRVYTFAEG